MKIFRKGPYSEFSKNVVKLMSGSMLAHATPFVAAPILARIYEPEDFGQLALFLSIIHILSIAINGRYEQAIVLPKSESKAYRLVLLCFLIDTVVSTVFGLVILIFQKRIINFLNVEESFAIWLWAIPAMVWLFGIYNPLIYLSIRSKRYGTIATTNVMKALTNNGVAVFSKPVLSNLGLVAGQIFSYIMATWFLLRSSQRVLIEEWKNLKSITSLVLLAKHYGDFPKYSIGASLISSIALNLNNLFINKYFNTYLLGLYSYSFKYVNLPLALISDSFRKVFLQAVADEMRETGYAKNVFVSTLKKMLLISIPGFALGYFLVEDAFALIFGEKWIEAGRYAKILFPLFFIKFVSSPLSVVNQVFEKQHYGLIIQITILTSTLSVMALSISKGFELTQFLETYNWILSIVYLLLLVEEYLVVTRKI